MKHQSCIICLKVKNQNVAYFYRFFSSQNHTANHTVKYWLCTFVLPNRDGRLVPVPDLPVRLDRRCASLEGGGRGEGAPTIPVRIVQYVQTAKQESGEPVLGPDHRPVHGAVEQPHQGVGVLLAVMQ